MYMPISLLTSSWGARSRDALSAFLREISICVALHGQICQLPHNYAGRLGGVVQHVLPVSCSYIIDVVACGSDRIPCYMTEVSARHALQQGLQRMWLAYLCLMAACTGLQL